MTSVFVSYRRADAQGWAGRLEAGLARAFGPQARYFDLVSVPPGADFRDGIGRALAQSAAVLVLIGPRWLDMRDEQGLRRLDQIDDLVATEVSLALARPTPTIPVLLGGAAMPAPAALPERLRDLARLNAFELSDLRWDYDCERLFAALEAATTLVRAAPMPSELGAVRVGAGMQLEDSEVGSVTGTRGAAAGSVDVLSNATVKRTKIDSIVGVDVSRPAPER